MKLADLLDVDWDGFGRTRGAFVGGDHYTLFPSVALTGGTGRAPELRVTASGGFALEVFSRRRWDHWAEYRPPLTVRLADLLPVVRAPRGPIRFVPPERR